MKNLPRAILFDLDDTIIDDTSGVEDGWLSALNAHSTQVHGLDIVALLRTIHDIRRDFWADPQRNLTGRANLHNASAAIAGEALRRFGKSDPDLARDIANTYRDLRANTLSLFPEAIETLERTRRQGIRAALLTNGSSEGQRAKIVRFDLAQYFDYICIEGEFGCGKPDERVYRTALDYLDCAPAETWMIGDNLDWDVAAPMRLGINGIWHDRFRTGLPVGTPVRPDRIVNSIGELFTLT